MATGSTSADPPVDTFNSSEKEQACSFPNDTADARSQGLARCWTLTDGYSCCIADDFVGQPETPDLQRSLTVQWDNGGPESPQNFRIWTKWFIVIVMSLGFFACMVSNTHYLYDYAKCDASVHAHHLFTHRRMAKFMKTLTLPRKS